MDITHMKKLVKKLAAITLIVAAGANAAAAQTNWSFVLLGDTRDGDNTSTGISTNLPAIAQKIASLHPQLVIVAGDFCNGNALNTNSPLYPPDGNFTNLAMKAVYAKFFDNWKAAMQPVFDYSAGTGIPIYTVRGNHESNDTGQAPIEVLKQAYREAFSAYVPTNGPNNDLTNDQRGFSWSLTTNNVTFVAVDQYFNFDRTYVGGTTPWSGYHYIDQAWVTQQLRQASSPYKILITHEPAFQTVGNGPIGDDQQNEVAQHFFGTNNAAMQTRSNFWNDLGDAGAQMYYCGHLHLESVGSTTNNHGHTIIHLLGGNGGAPAQDFIGNPEPGVTPLYNNGNILVTNGGNVSVQAYFGFVRAIVTDDNLTIQYYSLNPTNSSPATNSWIVADYVTQITSARARPIISMPFDPRAGTFSYTRSDPAGTGLSYSIETSPDLKAWSVDAGATQTVTGINNNTQTVQVVLSGPKPLTAPRLFIRVRAQ
jgi:hypothetical protein